MFHTTLDVAGVTIALRVRGPFDGARFRHRFAPYEIAPRPADASLDLFVEPQGKLLIPADVPYPGVKSYVAPGGVKLLREGLSLWVPDDLRAEAFVRGPEKFPPMPHTEDGGAAETPLRILASIALLGSGRGALFHACGHADERGAILFLGHSGAGKTTLALALPPPSVLSDDQVALRLSSPLALSPSPFVGVLGRTIPPRTDALRAVVLLDHERTGNLTPLREHERLPAIMSCLPLYARTRPLAAAALRVAHQLSAIPAFRGSFARAEGPLPWINRAFALANF